VPGTYREQYERARRWYARLEALDVGRDHTVESDNYVDEVYAFFMNCYHVKDWIRNDPDVPEAVRARVEQYVNSSRPLSLCADICNALKHLTLNGSRSGESPSFGSKRYRLAFGGAPKIGLTYEIETAKGATDAFTLATECMEDWGRFLSDNGLD